MRNLIIGGIVLLVLFLGTSADYMNDPELVYKIAAEHRLLGASIFSLIMFVTTVIAPLTAMPMVPMVAPLLGPFTVGLACFIGWTFGALVSFCIGRYWGQPVVKRFINPDTLRTYEQYVRPDMSFVLIVTLRMLVPVDILSYALSIFTTVPLSTYAPATMIGILWFSFALAYLGDALASRDYVLFGVIGVASVVIIGLSWWYARRKLRQPRED